MTLVDECKTFLTDLHSMWAQTTRERNIDSIVTRAEKLLRKIATSGHIDTLLVNNTYKFLNQFLAERWHSSFSCNWEHEAINHYSKIAGELIED